MAMISCLPLPYADEDFRSILKRYHLRSGNKNEIESRRELLGTDARTILPRNINFLFKQLPEIFKKDDIIFKHTVFPLLYPFVNDEMKGLLIGDIEFIKKSTYSASSGLNKYISKQLRYCPECMKSDNSIYGEIYARRIHQIIGFNFCLYHEKSLVYEFSDENITIDAAEINLLKPILNEVLYILNYKWTDIHSYEIKFKYIVALYEKGYLLKNGKPKTNILINDLLIRYGSLLSKLGIDSHYLTIHNRIWKMVNLNHNNPNPILHIVIACFLKGTTENFLAYSPIKIASDIPFGNGPWFCHNHLCASYFQKVISTCRRKFRKCSLPTAEFECPHCGFTYVKNITNTEEEYTVVSYGKVWVKELVYKYKNTYSLKETAAYCKVGQAAASKYLSKFSSEYQIKKAKKFYSNEKIEKIIKVYTETKSIRKTSRVLKINRNTIKSYIPKELLHNTNYFFEDKEEKVKVYKEKLINAINTLENPLRTHIRNAVGSEIYKFLMKEEKGWMEEVLPPIKTKEKNWGLLDEKISKEILKTTCELHGNKVKSRISKNKIKSNLSKFSRNQLQNNPSKLCKSTKALEESIETKKEFQIRKNNMQNLLK